MKKKERAVVLSQECIATDIYSMWIETPDIAAEAIPGQFITLSGLYDGRYDRHRYGQYDESTKRHYKIYHSFYISFIHIDAPPAL